MPMTRRDSTSDGRRARDAAAFLRLLAQLSLGHVLLALPPYHRIRSYRVWRRPPYAWPVLAQSVGGLFWGRGVGVGVVAPWTTLRRTREWSVCARMRTTRDRLQTMLLHERRMVVEGYILQRGAISQTQSSCLVQSAAAVDNLSHSITTFRPFLNESTPEEAHADAEVLRFPPASLPSDCARVAAVSPSDFIPNSPAERPVVRVPSASSMHARIVNAHPLALHRARRGPASVDEMRACDESTRLPCRRRSGP
ncbi:hypothetical protein HMN09_01390500 [Mycena chlorophos]|uniref:Uncharacterized protein n=1 Tax=Mycena chlorophos TaxID=658473 RepID=A0A8H6RWX0_MYCCL|nr:hypothetical protein HMN09_01390500 [Mycena chlorophos]